MSYHSSIAQHLGLRESQVAAVIRLLTEGATIPFISRYRKEATGSLDETGVAAVEKEWQRLQELDKRREAILKSIREQGKLTPELEARIIACGDMTSLEDLYLPYKPKRKTRASMARERGLEPLAKILMAQQDNNPAAAARRFVNADVPDIDAALAGARDIIAEWVSEHAGARQSLRRLYERESLLESKVVAKKKDEAANYQDYFDFKEPLNKSQSHRILAVFRGEEEGLLKVKISTDDEKALHTLDRFFVKGKNASSEQVELAVEESYDRLLAPQMETEMRTAAKEKADAAAIAVFSENLRQLLFAAPLGQKNILAIDPGFRTGCKVACLNSQGDLVAHGTVFPHSGDAHKALEQVKHWISKYAIEAIAIGNGTAGRETQQWLENGLGPDAPNLFLVNEAGASIYSASEAAREEFPDLDLTYRGAVSIGRRLMDPLAELVKIDPKSIGVGQYQHDVNQSQLRQNLDQTVVSVVNKVGVNLNTASEHLLQYVSGIGPVLAKNIVKYRSENGPFPNRSVLQKVKGLGPKSFEQSAGFLRIRGGENPLDNTSVHPERYGLIKKMAQSLTVRVDELPQNKPLLEKINLQQFVDNEVGLPTLNDILEELQKPGRDPRGQAETFSFDRSIKDITDLRPGMKLPGIVTNLAGFGAFVDIGIKENGLVHISQITNRFIKDPAEVLKLNQAVQVTVLEIDLHRKRIQLTMK